VTPLFHGSTPWAVTPEGATRGIPARGRYTGIGSGRPVSEPPQPPRGGWAETALPGAPAAVREAGEREARRAEAVKAVQDDGFVKDLVNLFDGKVVDSTIRENK